MVREKRHVVWSNFVGGWNPRNQPGEGYVWPRDLPEGQVLDAQFVEFSRGGIMRWVRNQLKIHPPHTDISDSNMGVVKSLIEYRTDDNNQLLAFVKYDTATSAGFTGRLYKLETDWDALEASDPVEWEYGHEIFDGVTWSHVPVTPELKWWGVSDFAQLDDVLVICQWGSTMHEAPLRWNGTDMVTIGIEAPSVAPTAAENAAAGTDMAAGTYSYYYTYTDGEFESMPSDIVDVVIADNSSITISNCADHPNHYDKKLYRAYTTDTSPGARGSDFFEVPLGAGELEDGDTSTTDTTAQYALGTTIAYDHALPPRGSIIEVHKDRLYMAGLNAGSSSYDGYTTGAWGNVLWWSAIQDPYAWPGDNQLKVGDNSDITNVISWRDTLFITKESSCYVLEGAAESNYVLRLVNAGIGCIDQNAAAAGPDGIFFAGAGAYYYWNGQTLREVLPMREDSPWAQWSSSTVVRTVCYHDGRFYVMQSNYILMWDPLRDVWTYQRASLADPDGYQTGLYAVNFSSKQAHILMRMQWYTLIWPTDGSAPAQHQYITVFHPTFDFDNVDSNGTDGPDVDWFAEVKVTLPPLIAPPGYTIQPLRIWVHGSWTTADISPSLQPHLYLNTTAEYEAATNAWATDPLCPSGGQVIGVPSGVQFGATASYGAASNTYRSNIAPLWYVQIYGAIVPDFVLEAVEVEYYVMPARGA